jgi:hypothetical protein
MILIALDVLIFAVVCLGNVKRGECASSAAWDCKLEGKWPGRLAALLGDRDHCRLSWQGQQHLYQPSETTL